jgi:tRNA (mo5U34)-methyltransferase
MEARNPLYTTETQKQIGELSRLGWYHSIELPDGQVIPGLQTVQQLRNRLAQFPIPHDLTGKRVLDIGAWDGWFSFEMEKRGAKVLALDSAEHTRFKVARELLGSKVDYQIGDICRISPRDIGRFDIVLFFGVLYHLKHPLLALETVCDLTTDMAFVESYVADNGTNLGAAPVMEFYETTELRGQFDNWVGPNTSCLLAFCRTAGFARVQFESVIDHRAHVHCFRKWGRPPACPGGAAAYITCVENSVTRDHSFSARADDYVAIWFKTDQQALTCDDVFPEIGAFGTRPVHVHHTGGDGWHANCKLPPGLDPGWYAVRLRVRDSDWSNEVRIGVDVPRTGRPEACPTSDLKIRLITDGRTWERYRVRTGTDACVSLWVEGLPDPCEPRHVSVRLNGTDLPAIYVSAHDREGASQVNALMPAGLTPGRAEIAFVFSGQLSPPVELELISAG